MIKLYNGIQSFFIVRYNSLIIRGNKKMTTILKKKEYRDSRYPIAIKVFKQSKYFYFYNIVTVSEGIYCDIK